MASDEPTNDDLPEDDEQRTLDMILGDDDTFYSLGDDSTDEAFHGFVETPTTIALVLSQLRDGESVYSRRWEMHAMCWLLPRV